MFVYHVSVEPEGVRSPGTRVKGSCKLPFEPKPSARTNAIEAEQPPQPVSNFTNWHSHLCFARVNLLCLQYPLSWIMAPVVHCLILAQQSLNLNPSFLAPHLITTLSSLKLLWLPTRPHMTDSVCSESPHLHRHWITVPWDGNNGLTAVLPPKLNLPMTLKNITAFFPTAFSYGVLYSVLPKYFSKVRLISSSCYLFLLSAYQNHTHS